MLLRLIAIFLLTVALFSRLIGADFLSWDDDQTIAGNPWLRGPLLQGIAHFWLAIGTNAPMRIYIPAVYTLWMLLAKISVSPALFHSVNIVVHAGTAVLVARLLIQLQNASPLMESSGTATSARLIYFIPALVFALHPVQVEAVGWASGLKDLLSAFFAVWGLIRYVRLAAGVDRSGFNIAGCLLLFLLAMLSKPSAVMVPVMAITIDRCLLNRPWKRVLHTAWPALLLMLPCLIWTTTAQPAKASWPLPLLDRLRVALDVPIFYLAKLAWPVNLCVDYGHRPASVLASPVTHFTDAAAIALAFLVFCCRKHRWLLSASLLFLLPLLPVLGLTPFEFQYFSTTADHYLYMPMLGLALLTMTVLGRSRIRYHRWPRHLFLLAIAGWSILDLRQQRYWFDTTVLFQHVLAVNPNSFVAYEKLGDAQLQTAGDDHEMLQRAADWYERSIDHNPEYVPSILSLALTQARLGRHQAASDLLWRICQLQSQLPPGKRAEPSDLAHLFTQIGDPASAKRCLDMHR